MTVKFVNGVMAITMRFHSEFVIACKANHDKLVHRKAIILHCLLDLGVTWVCVHDLTWHQNDLKVD